MVILVALNDVLSLFVVTLHDKVTSNTGVILLQRDGCGVGMSAGVDM